ncbi:MAG: cation:proton antiporter [Bacteroidota bacterium]|jgi:Kef-type K+ transport system membrane component KefB
MKTLNHQEIISLILSLGILLIVARLVGEFFRKLKMPLVVGELVAGICLGPSLLGQYFPKISNLVLNQNSNSHIAFNGITSISVIMLLFVAGMEVDLSIIRQQGKTALKTSFLGLIIPLGLGFLAAYYFFPLFGENYNNHFRLILFSLFFGTAMAVSALPIIARTLMDLGLFRTKVGMIIIAAAMFDDIIGWLLFSVILGMLKTNALAHGFLYTLGLTILYAVAMLTIGRIIINKSLPWAKKNFSWPGGFLSISLGMAFLGAAFTEFIGIHAIFGAFIVGIAFGDSVHLTEKTREIVNQFVTNIFAPLFFVSIGFKVNFFANFDIQVTALVLVIAIVCKLLGAGLGALWGGLTKQESLAVGFGMNARGAMEIILALLALQAGLINQKLFVAIVIMAVVTSVMAGPALQLLVKRKIDKDKEELDKEQEEMFV